MSVSRRRFSVTVPDWGQDHLSSDAIVAFVDNELAEGPHTRATRHVAECPECAAQVVAQRQARAAIRSATCPRLPSSLLSSLRSIPQDADLPPSPPGLAVSADGQLVSVLRPERQAALGLVSLDEPPAGLADVSSALPGHSRRPPVQRRGIRFGAGAAVSGLALGALAFGAAPGVESGSSPTPDSVLGGAPSGITDASMRVTPTEQPDPLIVRMDHVPASFLGLH